jgi:hypothetical protein
MLRLSHLSVNAFLDHCYLQPAQDDEVQPPQPELLLDAPPLADLPMPKRDRRLLVFFDPHFSHTTSGLAPNTSFSKAAPQALQ